MITIRRAQPDDGMAIRRMVFDTLCEYGVPADPDDSDADIMDFGSSKVPGVVHLVADLDGKAVGSAILTPYNARQAKLTKLFVGIDHRREGIGRQLMTRALEEARSAGYEEVFLTTRAVYREAVNLYERANWLRGPDQPPPGPERLYYTPLKQTEATQRSAASGTTVSDAAR